MLPPSVLADLRRRYAEPQRHYHTWTHIEALLNLFAEVRAEVCDTAAVEAAIYFHDAIYDPRRADNEAASAALLRQDGVAFLAPDSLAFAVRLVEATAGHDLPADLAPAPAGDAALFLDMDLSILAAGQAGFEAYEAAIRREYAHVGEAAFRAGRRRVLEGFLARERLYFSDRLGRRFEARARANLARSLRQLRGKGEGA